MNHLFLGIDIGTTAIKLGVIADNQIIYQNQIRLTTYHEENRHYQLPQEILDKLTDLLLDIPKEMKPQLKKMGISCAMHSLILRHEQLEPLIYLWSDQQAAKVIQEFKTKELAETFYLETGTPIHSMSPFAKIAYFKESLKKEVYQGVTWSGIKELVMEFLTGQAVLDYATASATGLFSSASLDWSAQVLEYLELDPSHLSKLVDSKQGFLISEDRARDIGLPLDLLVYAGASDGCLAAYASYYLTGNASSLTIGTSAAVRKVVTEPRYDWGGQNFSYYLTENCYVIGAPSNNGGIALDWLAGILYDSRQQLYDILPTVLAETPIGSHGLVFKPFLNGERAPYWQQNLSASFQQLTIKTSRQDIIKSVVEGMLLNIKQLVDLLGIKETVSMSGGFFQIPGMSQLLANVIDCPCYLSEQNEPIFGLYYLLEAPNLQQITPHQEKIEPQPREAEAYQELSEKYFS
ncbi:gluconokinase [Granulicatella seriolae]|uniref:FGGY family carbohydrate kinase n=1 Tax=Granulicatella seriolae TaxID=2967226 RepID=A0ABT1WQ60_9LACT|nr:FGGY family carbohydrate kinase [Granulicatella seriolae]